MKTDGDTPDDCGSKYLICKFFSLRNMSRSVESAVIGMPVIMYCLPLLNAGSLGATVDG